MTRVVAIAAVCVTFAATSVLLPSPATARAEPTAAATKVIDRTLVCAVGLVGGIHQIYVQANVGTRVPGNPAAWRYLASAGVASRIVSYGDEYTLFVHYSLAGVSAGDPLRPDGFKALPERLTFLPGSGCRSAQRIPFSRSGIVARRVGGLTDQYISCYPGTRVVVRIRGTFAAPTRLRRVFFSAQADPTVHLVAAGAVVHGELAVRSATGKPLAYAEVFQNGKAKLFTSRSCAG